MSLSSETSRVMTGMKGTLKTILEKMGATVSDSEKVDGYPALAGGVSKIFSVVNFESSSWVQGEDDLYTITIPKASHQRNSASFGVTIWHYVTSRYVRNTWAALCTDVQYDAATENIILTSETAYPGKIAFMG